MEKTYVLDTSVLLQTPYALEAFEDNQIVLPIAVLEELDALKGAEGEQGTNARQAIRRLEALRAQGNLLSGVPLPHGFRREPIRWMRYASDIALLLSVVGIVLAARSTEDDRKTWLSGSVCVLIASIVLRVLVTKNILLRIKAQILGLPAEDFTSEQAPVSADQYTGRGPPSASSSATRPSPRRPSTQRMCTRPMSWESGNPWTWCATSSSSSGPTSPARRPSWAGLTGRKSSPWPIKRKSPMASPPGTWGSTSSRRP